jgi:hypothetical protein
VGRSERRCPSGGGRALAHRGLGRTSGQIGENTTDIVGDAVRRAFEDAPQHHVCSDGQAAEHRHPDRESEEEFRHSNAAFSYQLTAFGSCSIGNRQALTAE